MSAPLVLIQLVSEQTMQNLLPILRLNPERVIHLVTPKTAGKADWIRRAAESAGFRPTIDVAQMSPMPGVSETLHEVSQCIEWADERGLEPVVNFTGGTKLMSIGSYSAAQSASIPSLYVDSQDSCFVDGATSHRMNELLGGDWSFTPIRRLLDVATLAMANGVERVSAGESWRNYLELAAMLFNDVDLEQRTHDAFHAKNGVITSGEPRSPEGWLGLLDIPISLPFEVAASATRCGVLKLDECGRCFFPDETREELEILANNKVPDHASRYYRAIACLQKASTFMCGGWWEVIVADAMERTGVMRDLRWSVQVKNSGSYLEEDVVALNGVELVYVSCKRGGERSRLLPLLEEIRARAATMGGTFNRRFVAVFSPPTKKGGADLQNRARALGIKIITGQNVYDPGVFS